MPTIYDIFHLKYKIKGKEATAVLDMSIDCVIPACNLNTSVTPLCFRLAHIWVGSI